MWDACVEERETLRLALQAAIWMAEGLVGHTWSPGPGKRLQTFPEQTFRDISLPCEKVGGWGTGYRLGGPLGGFAADQVREDGGWTKAVQQSGASG